VEDCKGLFVPVYLNREVVPSVRTECGIEQNIERVVEYFERM
jgi:hypothetical protein